MIAPADLDHCRDSIRTGSYSFHAASRLLPGRVRDPALVLYAFCRLADDAVDETEAKAAAVLRLRDRLDLCYQGRPVNAPEDRAFAAMVAQYDMPQALPEALLEGFAWDAEGRRYDTLSGVLAYSARVASAVGAMMCVLMGVRDADRLARACDLGLAMQLTNIARDVGEDARAGRLYLPLDWLDAARVDVAGFLSDPRPTPEITALTRRLLDQAGRLYARADAGVAALPLACRPGVGAARRIYAAIGDCVAQNGHDSITCRARTTGRQKVALAARAFAGAAAAQLLPWPATLHARPEPEVAFLVNAARKDAPSRVARSEAMLDILAQLAQSDRQSRA